MDLINKIQNTIAKHNLCTKSDSILVGVSGGMDSVALCKVLHHLGYSVAIAHFNFMLRGAESNGDEKYVCELAKSLNVKIHTKTCNTKKYAEERKISIEMAARELRYSWFESLCKEHNYTKIAIAHNSNDTVETFFINLFRKSGLRGLTGIPVVNNKVIRPLIETSRSEIESYIAQTNTPYKTDSTNLENHYLRNKIRNQLLPLAQEISPQSFSSILQSIKYLQKSYLLYSKSVQKEIDKIVSHTEYTILIEKEQLANSPFGALLLFEVMHPLGFNPDVIEQLFENLNSQSGKKYICSNKQAIIDRNYIFIDDIPNQNEVCVEINEFATKQTISTDFGDYVFEILDNTQIEIERNSAKAYLDLGKVEFPLTLRSWQSGDVFTPLGMKGKKKKVSDFLIDTKEPQSSKHKILVLESKEKIAWLVERRISNDFAVSEKTKKMLLVYKI